MNVEHKKQFEVHNLLACRKIVSSAELHVLIERMNAYIKSCGAIKTGGDISATYDINEDKIDVVIYMPINMEIPSSDCFEFKKKLLLMNCIKTSYEGHPQGLKNVMMKMNEYIIKNTLEPASVGFVLTVNEVKDVKDINDYRADIYISINENII